MPTISAELNSAFVRRYVFVLETREYPSILGRAVDTYNGHNFLPCYVDWSW